MAVTIHSIREGITHTYVLADQGTVLIDPGGPNRGEAVLRKLRNLPVVAGDIQLIVITHGHVDHIGAASTLREATGAKIAIHQEDARWAAQGVVTMPRGVTPWGRFLYALARIALLPWVRFPPVEPDLVLEDEELSLEPYGVAGRILHTPGHTSGSVSVLLDSGDIFVGDMAMNGFPFCRRPSFPIFAEDLSRLRETWRGLIKRNVRVVYPAHGKPFSADALRRYL